MKHNAHFMRLWLQSAAAKQASRVGQILQFCIAPDSVYVFVFRVGAAILQDAASQLHKPLSMIKAQVGPLCELCGAHCKPLAAQL